MIEDNFEIFPVLDKIVGGLSVVPVSFIKSFESEILKNHGGQSIERLAERGGLSYYEIYAAARNIYNERPHLQYLSKRKHTQIVANGVKNLLNKFLGKDINI